MKIIPLADRVVIKTVEVEETTKGGLILTGSAKEKPQVAQVVAVGPGGVVDGKEVKMTVKVGDKVLTSKYSGTEVKVEVTTYRSDTYDPDSRKPEVNYGDTLGGDLSRRDFTVNAMALRVPDLQFVDPFGGASDLSKGVLRTPVDPRQSFDDDPLRMMRAVRFVAQLGFRIAPDAAEAITSMRDRIDIVSAERVRDELTKLLLSDRPRAGLEALVESGLAA